MSGTMSKLLGVVTAAVVAAFVMTPAATAASASRVATVPTPASARIVSDPHNGHHIVVHRGDSVQVTLVACETCGYSWDITARPSSAVASAVGRASTRDAVCYPGPCAGGNAA